MEELVLLDTGILFDFLAKKKGSEAAKTILIEARAVLSSVTVYELFRGVVNKKHIEQREQLLSLCEVLDFNKTIAKKASEIYTNLKKKGQLIPNQDIMIAATALHYKCPLLTTNTKDFKRVEGVTLL